MKEKLIELCEDLETLPCCDTHEAQADYLIAKGVTIPVRCKDCKSCMFCYPEKKIGKEPTPGWYCKEQKSYRRPDDFCSYGERRTDG